jgi:Holliday junction resolvase RusA-like endonuclease
VSDLKPVSFLVPGEPQGKGRPRIGKVGAHARMFTPTKTLAYEGLIALAAQTAMDGRPMLAGPVLLEMKMLHPIRDSWSKKKKAGALAGEIAPTIKCDADNCLKAVCDALNGIVWKDDVQVVNVVLSKRFAETPGVSVRVVPLEMLPA